MGNGKSNWWNGFCLQVFYYLLFTKTFKKKCSYEKKEFEKLKTVDLIENGNQIDVVESNKKEFVKAMAYAKMAKEIEAQTEAMIQGITEIIPAEALSVINEKDLGVRLAGVPSINGMIFFRNIINFL